MVQESQRLPESIREVMERMPQAFRSDSAAGVNAVIQFQFTGAEVGNWVVNIADGKCTVEEGQTENANVTLNSPSDVWLKIMRRELDGATALYEWPVHLYRRYGHPHGDGQLVWCPIKRGKSDYRQRMLEFSLGEGQRRHPERSRYRRLPP